MFDWSREDVPGCGGTPRRVLSLPSHPTVQTCHSQDPADSRPRGTRQDGLQRPRTPGRSGTPAGNQPLAQATALHAGARILTEYPSDRDGEPLLAATANGEQ